MTLVPAYGRDYKSKKEVLEAFSADKDFDASNNLFNARAVGTYTNKTDLLNMGIDSVTIRYKKLTQCVVVRVK